MSGLAQLSDCGYGKINVRLVKVERNGSEHNIKDINVAIQVFGHFEAAYSEGDNRFILPTDTMKNTVYVLARQRPLGEIEDFGMRLSNHFLTRNSYLARVRVSISEKLWQRIGKDPKSRDSGFQMLGQEARTAVIDSTRDKISIQAGITGLDVLKTSRSAFENFLHDEYTTLKETKDRLFSSSIDAEWMCSSSAQDFGIVWRTVRGTLLNSFAAHDSPSVQHTLYVMGEAVLQQLQEITEIRLSMSNRHCLLADLSQFNLVNPNEVFIPIDEPSGIIEATLKRKAACEAGKAVIEGENPTHNKEQVAWP